MLTAAWASFDVLLVLDQVSEPDCGVVTARVRDRLGWATDQEVGGPGARQAFGNGSMYWIGASNQILVLYEYSPFTGLISRWQLFNDTFNQP